MTTVFVKETQFGKDDSFSASLGRRRKRKRLIKSVDLIRHYAANERGAQLLLRAIYLKHWPRTLARVPQCVEMATQTGEQ